MKKLILTTAMIGLTACGGGGGGGGEPELTARQVCSAYCDFTCGKTFNCLGLATDGTCARECISDIDQQGTASVDRCQNAFDNAASMNCDELLAFFGLTRTLRESDQEQVSTLISGLI